MKMFQTNATVSELLYYAHTPPEFQNKGAQVRWYFMTGSTSTALCNYWQV